jgi:hypothetical protein
MRIFVTIAMICVGFGLFACSIGGGSNSNVFTLYRNSVTNANMRIHVATFDADEKEEYNRGNCEQAQALFQAQPGVQVKFWCEKGRFRK